MFIQIFEDDLSLSDREVTINFYHNEIGSTYDSKSNFDEILLNFARFDEKQSTDSWNKAQWLEIKDVENYFLGNLCDKTSNEILSIIIFKLGILGEYDHLLRILTKIDCRRMSFAKLLFSKSLALLQKNKSKGIYLEVRADNLPAIKMYNGLKFNKIHLHKKYYSDNGDAVKMIFEKNNC